MNVNDPDPYISITGTPATLAELVDRLCGPSAAAESPSSASFLFSGPCPPAEVRAMMADLVEAVDRYWSDDAPTVEDAGLAAAARNAVSEWQRWCATLDALLGD